MNREQFTISITQTYNKGLALIETKNSDYAKADNPFRNFEDSAALSGVRVENGILLRIGDKLSRIRNLLDKPAAVVDESLEDTLVDAINYLAILKAYREKNKVTEKGDLDNPPYCKQLTKI